MNEQIPLFDTRKDDLIHVQKIMAAWDSATDTARRVVLEEIRRRYLNGLRADVDIRPKPPKMGTL